MHMLAYIHTLRFLSLFISSIAFICHIAQCILTNVYQQKAGIPDWLSAGHGQYLFWFISLSLSLAGSFTLCLSACYLNRPKKYSWDKWIGSLVILPVFVSIITTMTSDSFEPWANGLLKLDRSPSALVKSCSIFNASRDKFHPLLYQRCVLIDSTWIFSIILCIIWALLVGFAIFASLQRKNSIHPVARSAKVASSSTTKKGPQEPNWGRYIPDKPPAASIYSVTTRRSSIGLLTPTSVKYGSQYYFEDYESSVPNLPSTNNSYYSREKEGGGGYYDDSYSYKDDYKSPISPSSPYYYNSSGRSAYYHNNYGKKDYRSPSTFSSSSYNYYGNNNNYSSPPTPSSYYHHGPTTPTTEYSSYDQEKQHLMRPSATYRRDSSPSSITPSTKSKDEEDDSATKEISTPLYLKFASKKTNNYSLR